MTMSAHIPVVRVTPVDGDDALRATFAVALARLPQYEITREDHERLARGEVAEGEPLTLYLGGRPLVAKFGGKLDCR